MMFADFVRGWSQLGLCCVVIGRAGVLPPFTVGCLVSKYSGTYRLSVQISGCWCSC